MQKKYVNKRKRTTKNRRRTMLILVILIVGIIYLINNSKKQLNRIGTAEQTLETEPIELDSIVQGFLDNDFVDGDYTVKVNGEQYKVEVVNYYEDVVYSLALGETSKTISLGDGTTEYKTLVVKYHGDLTIDEGVTVTASTVNNLTYKKGMYICVVGKLVNNGTITMTARGTYNCAGQNVYLWQNEDGTYEYVPALGATGGASQSTSGQGTVLNGKNGNNGANRQTGGGGTGGGRNWWKTVTIGAGGRGTSFSGGSGSGAANSDGRSGGVVVTAAGSSIGGPGSAGIVISSNTSGYAQISLGGTGNPTGGYASYRVSVQNYVKRSGTGGLLILFSNALINNGTISANGVTGSTATPSDAWKNSRVDPGGSSGGGSVNIFTRVSEKGNITANGGAAVQISSKSGAGGNGTVTINEIEGLWMSYTDRYVLLSPGDTYTVDENKVLIFGDQIGKSLSYNVEDLSIATLESHGTIKAKAVGSTKLIITDKLSGKSTNVYIEVSNAATQTPNAPTLSAGMIPIKWDGNYWTITEATDTSWYDYASGKPAYIMLNDGVYQSELVRDMTDKKLAEKYVGYRINEEELGSIYMWVPRYAYSRLGKIQYIKQEYNVVGQWTMPEIFKYETESIDFSLAGVWVELKPLTNSSAVTTKVNNMNIEENAYGFIANTVGIDVPKDPQSQDTIKKFVKGYKVLNNPIEEYENANRTILKIYDTTKKEPIKAKVTYSDGKVIVELMYFKYGINKVITENGTQLTKIDTNKYELSNLNDISYTYKIIDNEGNEKELSLDGIYIIPDAGTLSRFREEVNSGNTFAGTTVIQTADIDMSGICSATSGSWIPIGATGTYFAGTYNGNYNTLSNLYISTGEYQLLGLFSRTASGTVIKNLIMENPYVYNNYNTATSDTGAVAGGCFFGEIINCASIGGSITGCQTGDASSLKVTRVGGIAGQNYAGTITDCFNTSTIKAVANTTNSNCHSRLGGITGFSYTGGIVINCYNSGNVTGEGYRIYIGGVIGSMQMDTTVTQNCYNYGQISITSGTQKYIGGIVGTNGVEDAVYKSGIITNSYCITDTTYSYYYYSGGYKTSIEEIRSSEELKTYASKLGSAYKDDTYGINNGYPVLTWQEGGFLEKQKIMASAYYDELQEKVFVDISYTKHGISKVVTDNGIKLTKVDTNKYELANLNDITTTYKVIDNQGNEKEVKLIGVYIIPNVQALSTFRDEVNAGNNFAGINVIQTANIDMSSICSATSGSWIPIGATGTYFAGTYNGNYNTISNLYINSGTYASTGLFSQTETSTIIQNLIIESSYVYNSYNQAASYTGAIVARHYGTIKNCASIGGTITGYQTTTATSQKDTVAGGITGGNGKTATISNCFNTSTISVTVNTSNSNYQAKVGGISGGGSGSISNCYNTGSIIGEGHTLFQGGVIGLNWTSLAKVTNCYNYGTLSIISFENAHVAGVAGSNGGATSGSAGTISNCYCTTASGYSYYYYSSGKQTSTTGRVAANTLKGYASKLGSAYKNDTYGINNGYPVLTWQEGGFLDKQKIMANAYYDETEEKVYVDISYTKHGIKEVITSNGIKLTKVDANKYELANLNDITYAYTIIDNDGNEKKLKIHDIYIIPDVQTLCAFRDELNAGKDFTQIVAIQTADIDMSSVCSATKGSWTLIGKMGGPYYTGTYNGNYNTISNLYVNSGESVYAGLFYAVYTGGTVQNLIMENAYVYNSYTEWAATGAICGTNGGTIKNCASIGGTIIGYHTTTATSYKATIAGGISGYNDKGTIINCFNTSTISATANTSNKYCHARLGGIVGISKGGTVSNCYNAGNITGKGYNVYAGGILGLLYQVPSESIYATLTNCYNYGAVAATSGTKKYVGGVVGSNGTSATNPGGSMSNFYCTTGTTYTGYYYSSGYKTSTTGRVAASTLKGYASTLGSAFVTDSNNINNGYPILTWQTKISE